jgi:hypothetical protein
MADERPYSLSPNFEPDIGAARRALLHLRRNASDGVCHIMAIHPETGPVSGLVVDVRDDGAWADAALTIGEWQMVDGAGVYFTVARIAPDFMGTKPSKANLLAIDHLQVDLDPDGDASRPYDDRRAEHRRKRTWLAGQYKPTLVTDSGHGANVVFELEHGFGADALAAYEARNRALNEALDAKGTHNADRVLRLPGTWNFPSPAKLKKGYPPEPVMASIVAVNDTVFLPGNLPGANRGAVVDLALVAGTEWPGHVDLDAVPDDLDARVTEALAADSTLAELAALDPKASKDRSADLMAIAHRLKQLGFTPQEYVSAVMQRFPVGKAHAVDQPSSLRALERAWERCGATAGIRAHQMREAITEEQRRRVRDLVEARRDIVLDPKADVDDTPLVLTGTDLVDYTLSREESRQCRLIVGDDTELLEDPNAAEVFLQYVMEARQSKANGGIARLSIVDLPGAVGAIAQWAQLSGRRVLPYDVCAFTALVALSAGVAHRAVVDWDNGPTALNLEGLLQISSSVGKENLRSIIKQVNVTLDGSTISDDPPSKEGMHREMLANEHRALCVMIDEFGKEAEKAQTGRAPNTRAALDWLMKVYGLPFGVMEARSVRDPRNSLPAIENPYLTGFHTTADDLGDGLRQSDVYGGLLGRKLYMRGPDTAPMRDRGEQRLKVMPQEVEEHLGRIYRLLMPVAVDARGRSVPKQGRPDGRLVITMTPEAEDAYYDWQDICEARFGDLKAPDRVLWGRLPAMTISVAGILALGDAEREPVTIAREHMTQAVNVVSRCARDLIDMSRNEIGSDTAEGRMQKRIISALRKRGGEMLKSELTAALRGDAASRRVREEALKDLVEEGVVLRREEQVAKTTREIFTLVEWRLAQ